MQVYINYPNPHFTIHRDPACKQIQRHEKVNQRRILIRPENLKAVLADFINDAYDFKPEQKYNDMWLDIFLGNSDQEFGLVYVIQAILGQRYKPLGNALVSVHCK
jgi:hypothetical protein